MSKAIKCKPGRCNTTVLNYCTKETGGSKQCTLCMNYITIDVTKAVVPSRLNDHAPDLYAPLIIAPCRTLTLCIDLE